MFIVHVSLEFIWFFWASSGSQIHGCDSCEGPVNGVCAPEDSCSPGGTLWRKAALQEFEINDSHFQILSFCPRNMEICFLIRCLGEANPMVLLVVLTLAMPLDEAKVTLAEVKPWFLSE